MMKLSILQIKNLWINLAKKIKHRAFPSTTFVSNLESKSEILALFAKNGEDTNQLEHLGFIICTKTIFIAHTDNIVSNQGIISNDYFSGEIIDVNNTIIPNVYIHLVKVNSGPIVINNISLYLVMNETFHYGLINNKIGASLFLRQLTQIVKIKDNIFNDTKISNEKFVINFSNSEVTRKKILQCESNVNFLLQKKLLSAELTKLSKVKEFNFVKNFTENELEIFNKITKIAIVNIKNSKNNWQITVMTGDEEIDKFFLELKKPLINAINILNKKIKTINQPEVIKPLTTLININNYENLLKMQKIYQKLNNEFKKWRLNSQKFLEEMAKNFAFSYFSEVIDDLRIVHYSFNNDLLDYNLMEIKGRLLLTNINNTILFLSNNITDNASMIILISPNLLPKYELKTIINKISSQPIIKISYKNDIIFLSTNYYQYLTEFISEVINLLKSDQFKHYLQLRK